jgi:hypothetical protein
MSYLLNASAVGPMGQFLAIHDEDKNDLFEPRYNYNYQARNSKQAGAGQGNMWLELWPVSRIASGDSTVSLALLGQDCSDVGRFEYQSSISRGMVRPYFIRGQCRDQNGNALGGAIVQGFLTANDLTVGEVACDANGYYELPTIYSGQNHYVVAYYASGSLAGTSVNTINPVL